MSKIAFNSLAFLLVLLATWTQRIGRNLLEAYATIATPDTILHSHRQRIALKWTFVAAATRKRVGRPRTAPKIEQLVIQLAKENASWGSDRIAGALANVGHEIAATTIDLGSVHQVAPSHARRRRLLHDRGVDQTRAHDGLHTLCDPTRDAAR